MSAPRSNGAPKRGRSNNGRRLSTKRNCSFKAALRQLSPYSKLSPNLRLGIHRSK